MITAAEATAPARWLLEAGVDGVALTEKHALARVVVREAAERFPSWWHADLFGPPHREVDLRRLEVLHEGLKRLRLMHRRGRRLLTTAQGRALAADPEALLRALAADLGRGDPFETEIADTLTAALLDGPKPCTVLLALTTRTTLARGWRTPDGAPPDPHEISWTVSDIRARGEAYGLLETTELPPGALVDDLELSAAGRAALSPTPVTGEVLVFTPTSSGSVGSLPGSPSAQTSR